MNKDIKKRNWMTEYLETVYKSEDQLKQELQEAIGNEEYEKAQKLKDRLNNILKGYH
jgi:protein-arginine kinase activator protein McsA